MTSNLLPTFLSLGFAFVGSALWISARFQRHKHNQRRTALQLLFLSSLTHLVIPNIPYLSFTTPIGDFGAVTTWILIAGATLEMARIGERGKISNNFDRIFILLLIGWIYIAILKIYQGSEFRPNFFYLPMVIFLISRIQPCQTDISALFPIIRTSMILLLFCHFIGFSATSKDYNFSNLFLEQSVYKNFSWEIFGQIHRFNGPFPHPNQTGTYLTVAILILMNSHLRADKAFNLLGVLLLLSTSSRGSMLALAVGIAIRQSSPLLEYKSSIHNANRTVFRILSRIVAGIGIIFLANMNSTLTGRTTEWSKILNDWQNGFWFGKSIDRISTENIYIYAFASTGIIGFVILILIMVRTYSAISTNLSNRFITRSMYYAFITRSLVEANFTLSVWNLGTFWLICVYILNNSDSMQQE